MRTPDGSSFKQNYLKIILLTIALETCAREAAEQDKRLEDHITHLMVHATLHLLGFDHISDAEATVMETLETEILGKMGIEDPYS